MNEEERDAIPDEQWQPLMQEGFDVKRGERSFTDGPFAETKEQLAGYVLIEAPDLEAAKEIALGLPPGRVGSVEVRPVWDRDDLVTRRVGVGQETQVFP